MDLQNFATVVPIIIICYVVGLFFKNLKNFPDAMIPIVVSIVGGIIAVPGMYIMSAVSGTGVITASAVGGASGLSSVGVNQLYKQSKKEEL